MRGCVLFRSFGSPLAMVNHSLFYFCLQTDSLVIERCFRLKCSVSSRANELKLTEKRWLGFAPPDLHPLLRSGFLLLDTFSEVQQFTSGFTAEWSWMEFCYECKLVGRYGGNTRPFLFDGAKTPKTLADLG